MAPKRARMGLLDSVIVLILSAMVVLLLLWIGAQIRGIDRFWNLPDWVTKVASSVWTYVAGVGSSTLLAYLRGRSDEPAPNYLLWIFGTVTVMLVMAFGVGYIIASPAPPRDALLMFWLKPDTKDRPLMSFRELAPDKWWYVLTLPPDQKDGHYQQSADFPDQDATFYARMLPAPLAPQGDSQPTNPALVCFKRKPKLPDYGAALQVEMDCSEGGRCAIDAEKDQGYANICSTESEWSPPSARLELFPTVYADSLQAESGWRVASMETLEAMPPQERPGYTKFSIESTQLGTLRGVKGFQYLIRVNGSPLYVDGWGPEDMVKPFDASKSFTFSFGLENLSFSGADGGCEDIEVDLKFRQNERVIEDDISRKYAALRDAVTDEVKAADGTTFTWSGQYVKPINEDKEEVFVFSAPSLREATAAKAIIDAAKLSYAGTGIVGVLRPPLNNPQYGIVVGLRQPTEQIRFTFDSKSARSLNEWVKNQRVQSHSIFPRGSLHL
jgi:hypothetical protein